MCNLNDCNSELCEAYGEEYQDVAKTIEEFEGLQKDTILVSDENMPTQEEVDEGLAAFDESKGEDNETTPKERLYNEILNLGEKIDRLNRYLNGRDINGVRHIISDCLTDAQVYLLHKQLEVMNEYYNILCSRYSIFDVKKPANVKGLTSAVEIVK